MAACGACNTTILFGGVREGEQRFCNKSCYAKGYLLTVARQIPPDTLREHVRSVHQGMCPKCHGAGPVDVHKSYRVWSAVFLTSWKNEPQVSCRSCGVKAQLGSTLFSLVLGWWGLPWGLIMTPVQVGRNVVALLKRPTSEESSADLQRLVSINMAAQLLKKQQAASAATAR